MKNYLAITNTAAVVALAFGINACSTQEEMVAKPAAKPAAPSSRARSESRGESACGQSDQNRRRCGSFGHGKKLPDYSNQRRQARDGGL